MTFDQDGNLIDYQMVLTGTFVNCGGGKTPWNTWVSCEEHQDGQVWQVDPTGQRTLQIMTIGRERGEWESFAYDVRDKEHPQFFVTEDEPDGALRRFRPDTVDWENDPWQMLHGDGILDYLLVEPDGRRNGTFSWTVNLQHAKDNAERYFPKTEGIDAHEGILYFVSKHFRRLYILDLDQQTYHWESTVSGIFDGTPDQMQRLLGGGKDDEAETDLLYFTEEGGNNAGIHARNVEGQFFSILESPVYEDETTGLAFSPNGKHMYVAYQETGILYDIWREDGLAFNAKFLNVKYHQRGSQ